MTETQQIIIEKMQQGEQNSKTRNRIKSFKAQANKFSVVFRLQDRQVKVTHSQYKNFYKALIWKLKTDGTPDLTSRHASNQYFYKEGLQDLFDTPLTKLEFKPVFKNRKSGIKP